MGEMNIIMKKKFISCSILLMVVSVFLFGYSRDFYITKKPTQIIENTSMPRDTNTKGDLIKGGSTLEQAMDYYLWQIEPSMGQRGEFYTARYRILAAEETPENVIVRAWVVSKWIDSRGNTASEGSGLYEINFKIENNLYIYESMRNIKIPEVPYVPQDVSDIVSNDGETIYAELMAEIEKDIQNYLGYPERPLKLPQSRINTGFLS